MSSSTTAQDAPKNADAPKLELVEIKNGKVIFRQKPLSFEKQSETMQEMIQFREFLEKRIAGGEEPLKTIPKAHLPLIAKLAHESDKTLVPLAKHLRTLLLPSRDDGEEGASGSAENMLPVTVIESAIKSILTRSNYGLEGYTGVRPPAAVYVWRWEVNKENLDWLPKSAREKAESRIKERVRAKQELEAMFQSLPQEARDNLVDPKGISKQATGASTSAAIVVHDTNGSDESKNQGSSTKESAGRPKKPEDPEKVAKERGKEEKKAAKAEKERKEREQKDKSRSLMANFFIKPKDKPASSVGTPLKQSGEKESRSARSDFETVFKPFVLRKDAEIAPQNRFLYPDKYGKNKVENGVIIVEDDDQPTKVASTMEVDLSSLSNKERLRSLLSAPSITKFQRIRPPHRPPCKSYFPVSVRTVMAQLVEAEISGDASLVGPFFKKLANRTLFPIKILIFWDDARPGYYGTWTRNSKIIGPRTPLARDVVEFDYGYQSGEDWEEEPNEGADDVQEEDGEEEEGSEADSDADSWLVGDDEEIEVFGVPDQDIMDPDGLPMPPPPPPKRKQEPGEKATSKKRKVVVPLVPFVKGPCYENEIGTPSYDAFESYRIQLFNDTPYPIDPFTFVSAPIRRAAAPPAPSDLQRIPQASSSTPSLSKHTSLPNPAPSTQTPNQRRANTMPKTAFPDTHLPVLISKLQSLEAASITTIVDAVHQELKAQKIKKNSIEAKIREVGEKCKEKRVWILKPGVVGP